MFNSPRARRAQPRPGPFRLLAAGLLLYTAFTVAKAEPFTNIAPLSPQPSAEAVKPGLAVEYLNQKFYTLEEIYSPEVKPVAGEPIPVLDQLSKIDPITDEPVMGIPVLTSDRSMLVGAYIRGMINFDKPGNWTLYLVSNDGVRFWIGDVQLWEDPEIHFDRESDPLELVIPEAGWYDFKLDYYQKKGTAALQLLWAPPGGEKQVVPAEALAHVE